MLKRSVGATATQRNIGIPVGDVGRFVRVQLQGSDSLQLAEVVVLGAPADYAI